MSQPGRANNFDLLRVIAATAVIFSHSFLIADGNDNHEPLILLTGRQSILGLCGVFVFFTISGFLVTQSWEATGSAGRFLAKRALRIYPGLACCLVVSAFVLGLPRRSQPPEDRELVHIRIGKYEQNLHKESLAERECREEAKLSEKRHKLGLNMLESWSISASVLMDLMIRQPREI